MNHRLYVAAGGGGDAIAAMMLHAAEGRPAETAHIATYAWERLAVDPLPGPRSAAEFEDLLPVGSRNHKFEAMTRPLPPSGSMLPRLSSERPEGLYLLDPSLGVLGMHEQLAELVELLQVEAVLIIDVGGDILADGTEESLRSPFADGLALAASADLDRPTQIVVLGPGLDGELDEHAVLERCRTLGATRGASLEGGQLGEFASVFDWHPSEASGLLWAAACGHRGAAEIRDSGLRVKLSRESARPWQLSPDTVLTVNRVAQAVQRSPSLVAAEQAVAAAGLKNELAYERSKAQRLAAGDGPTPADFVEEDGAQIVTQLLADARERNVDFLTVRRVTEGLLPLGVGFDEVLELLRRRFASQLSPPLLSTHTAA